VAGIVNWYVVGVGALAASDAFEIARIVASTKEL
jgi:hypothetical protein